MATLRWFTVVIFLVTFFIIWDSSIWHPEDGQNTRLLDLPRKVRQDLSAIVDAGIDQGGTMVDQCRAEYQRVTFNRTRGLTLDDLERSRALIGNRHRLANLARTLQQRNKPITGVVCGGSITLGHGVEP